MVLDHGRVVLDAAADDLRGSATTRERPGRRRWTSSSPGRRAWDRRRVASQESVVVVGALDDSGLRPGPGSCTSSLEAAVTPASRWSTPPARPPTRRARRGRAHEHLDQCLPLPPGQAAQLPGAALDRAGVRLRRRRWPSSPLTTGRRTASQVRLRSAAWPRSSSSSSSCGLQSVARSLPFGLALGVSRRSYYIGTALLAVSTRCGLRAGAHRTAGHRAGHRRLGPEPCTSSGCRTSSTGRGTLPG